MNLVADENVDRPIVDALRQAGHRVFYIAEIEAGLPDAAVLELAEEHGAVLVTADKDFGELVFRQRRARHGVVLLRLAGLSNEEKARVVRSVFEAHEQELSEACAVLTPETVRIRGLSS